ncbi:MAG: DMT family transporter [Burkholderiales bacterium]|jgi:drug/metabolite transporter (DMT)-like permease|nr:DMT family transporter [Burkholderiales bacterium]
MEFPVVARNPVSPTTRGVLEMGSAMSLLGSIGYFVLLSGLAPLDVVFWRCGFGLLTLALICTVLAPWRRPSARELGLAVLGGVAIVLNWVLLFGAYGRASVAVATAIYNLQPFLLMGLGAVFFGERLSAARLAWMGLAFVGMLLIVQARPSAGYVGGNFALGVAMALGAAALWAVAAVVAKRLNGMPAPQIALIQVGVGVLMLAPFADFGQLPQTAMGWMPLVVLGAVHTGLMYALMYAGVQRLPTALQGGLSFLYPVVAIGVDRLALGHALAPLQWLGAAVILLGAAGLFRAS